MLEVINASKTFAKGTPNEHKALDHLNLSLKAVSYTHLTLPTKA